MPWTPTQECPWFPYWTGQCLINAQTVHVGTGTDLSGVDAVRAGLRELFGENTHQQKHNQANNNQAWQQKPTLVKESSTRTKHQRNQK